MTTSPEERQRPANVFGLGPVRPGLATVEVRDGGHVLVGGAEALGDRPDRLVLGDPSASWGIAVASLRVVVATFVGDTVI
ncbi:hypothetical protein [Nocardioides sp.]|jgi:hypothetical protein|uniref:hypothetical protein n=1 Tax=Nocardioides sp. TaxID=35761 RepID=UPI002F409B1F